VHPNEEFLRQTLLPLQKAAQDEKVQAAGKVDFGVVAGREDQLDPLDLHELEVTVDRQEQPIIDGERIVATHNW
jgi:hypothetical protein